MPVLGERELRAALEEWGGCAPPATATPRAPRSMLPRLTRRGRLVWLRRAGEVARIKAAIETWDASVAGADRRWLEPVADASRKGLHDDSGEISPVGIRDRKHG